MVFAIVMINILRSLFSKWCSPDMVARTTSTTCWTATATLPPESTCRRASTSTPTSQVFHSQQALQPLFPKYPQGPDPILTLSCSKPYNTNELHPGGAIGMAPPLYNEIIEYDDGTPATQVKAFPLCKSVFPFARASWPRTCAPTWCGPPALSMTWGRRWRSRWSCLVRLLSFSSII